MKSKKELSTIELYYKVKSQLRMPVFASQIGKTARTASFTGSE
jgi:hypothetical protein